MSLRHVILIFGFSSIAACGGGDSEPTLSPPPAGGTPLVITAANAETVAAVAYAAAARTSQGASFIGSSGIAAAPGGSLANDGEPAQQQLVAGASTVPLGPIVNECPGGGIVTMTGTVASLTTLTPGDEITITSEECNNGEGEIVDGTLVITVDTFSGDLEGGLFLWIMDLDLIGFQVQTSEDTVVTAGDARITVDTTGSPVQSLSISGSSLSASGTQESMTITNYAYSQTIDGSVVPEPYTLTTSGTVESSELDGIITYTTETTFQGMGDGYPFAGELLILGGENSSIRLIAVDDVNVIIEIDVDGGGADTTIETTWAQIDNL